MSEKPFFSFNQSLISNGNMAGNLTSAAQEVAEVHDLAVQAVWSGSSPLGSTSLEYSLDGVNYTRDQDSSLAVSGNSGSNLYNLSDIAYKYIRLVYTATSGSGTLNVQISGKV